MSRDVLTRQMKAEMDQSKDDSEQTEYSLAVHKAITSIDNDIKSGRCSCCRRADTTKQDDAANRLPGRLP